MAKYEWSEVFMSIEGEAKYAGHPTAYIRFTKCNFQCKGFANPCMLDTTSTEVMGFNPRDYKDIYSIPIITRGCDSIYSWDEQFSHMWFKGDEHDLAKAVTDTIPAKSFINPKSNKPVILSITGGEPTLRAKFIPTLLNCDEMKDVKHILIETNCAVPFKQTFIDELNQWADSRDGWVTWSNSPKLSVSGEPWKKAIRPEIALMQRGVRRGEQYFKFVVTDLESDFAEIHKAMGEYYAGGIPTNVEVYAMPVAGTLEQQQAISAKVAQRCIEDGLIYCHRVHVDVYGNVVGT